MSLFNFETFRLGVRNLLLHKLRSLLTSLGIIFGVAAVICMLSVSEGASADELRMIKLLGTNNIIVNSIKPEESREASQGDTRLLRYGITQDDVDMISASVPKVAHVVPLKTVSHTALQGEYRMQAEVVATTPTLFEVVNVKAAEGRLLSGADLRSDANVCVIGAEVRRELFQFKEPLGATVLVGRPRLTAIPFEVVGVLQHVETAGAPARGVEGRNLNREIFIPFSAGRSQFGEITMKEQAGSREMTEIEYSGLYVTVEDTEFVLNVSEMVRAVFEKNHKDRDYDIKVPLERLKLAEQKKRNNQKILGLIASISLLVGGIGIMNIMLASVTERTREIGIRRALGARQAHIRAQFLIETVVLSTLGGVVGVLIGWLGALLLSTWAEWDPIISWWAILLSFGLSVLVGIVSGFYPAVAAAKLDPIEALRYE